MNTITIHIVLLSALDKSADTLRLSWIRAIGTFVNVNVGVVFVLWGSFRVARIVSRL